MVKFTANQKEFQNALGIAYRAVSAQTTMPILTCVFIEIHDEYATIVGNDMEKSIETSVAVESQEQGSLAVNAKMLLEIIRKLPDKNFTFNCDENYTIQIKSGKAKFSISGQSPDDFPELSNAHATDSISVTQGLLRKLIQGTIFSVGLNENNKMMSGILFDVKDGRLTLTALDGHRISIRSEEIGDQTGEYKVVVPSETLKEIVRILPDSWDDEVNIYFSKSHIVFELDNVRAISRLIDGEYFDISKVTKSETSVKVVVNREEICKSLERSMLLVKENAKTPIVLDISGDMVNMSIHSQMGRFDESSMCEHDGDNLEIAFNPKLILDALNAVSDAEVSLNMTNPKSPCFIKDENGTYNYVILPVNFVR